MTKQSSILSTAALTLGALIVWFAQTLTAATPPGTSLLDPVDLSPGPDAYLPLQLAANNSTHKLYVLSGMAGPDAFPPPAEASYAVKVIDTTSNTAVAGIDLGVYQFSGYSIPFQPRAIAADESQGTGGNKIYVLGSADYVYLRVLDGATNSNETGQGTDILLPYGGDQIAVNPNNHKVYITDDNEHVTVVDGPSRTILTTVPGSIGLYGHRLVVNPDTNKVFVFGPIAEEIIDSSDDSYTIIAASYSPRALTFDPGTGHVFLIAIPFPQLNASLYAFDGSTGDLLQSQSAIPANSQALAVDSAAGRLYLGQPVDSSQATTGEIAVFTADMLSPYEGGLTYPPGAARLAFLGTGNDARLYFLNYDFYFDSAVPEYRNMVGILNPLNGVVEKTTVGYSPGPISVNPVTNRIYLADEKAPELTVIDGSSRTVIDRIATAPAGSAVYFGTTVPPRSLAVSVAKNRVYLSRTSTDPMTSFSTMYVDVYDGSTELVLNSLVVNLDPSSANYPRIAVDDTRRRLYVTAYSSAGNPYYFVKVYDLDTNAFIATIPLPSYGLEIAVNTLTGLVYLSSGSLTVMIIDPATSTVTEMSTGSSPDNPGPISIDVQRNRIFVAETGSDNEVTVIDGATGEKETTISNTDSNPGDAVTDVAVDEVTNTLYVGDDSAKTEEAGRITAFDANNNYAFLGQIDVGRYPERIAFNTATRQLFVSNDQDGTLSVLENTTPAPPDRFANISTRLGVETNDNVLIGGFIVTGPIGSTKQVLIRGIGPSLTDLGVSGALADPILELHTGSTIISTNDNWKIAENGQSQQAAIEATTIPPTNDLESAILMNLAPGSYTAVMRGTNGGTGVGLVEVYDLTASATTKMVNISTRGRVDIGDNVMIGGVIVTGANPSHVILRAIGPSLTNAGVVGALQDPVLELHDAQGAVITTNDNWKDDNEVEILATGIPPSDDRESAIVATLYPANYTAIVRGKDDTTGVGLVEAYYLP